MVKQITQMFKENPNLKGLVLDLRNDPGGLLHGAVAISSAFLPAKTLVVSTDGRAEDAKKKFYATPDDYAARQPWRGRAEVAAAGGEDRPDGACW
jgi:carboxyl-terminal processing protease